MPHEPLRRPRPQPDPAEQGGGGHQRQDPDVARHLGQVVVRQESRLTERAGAAQQVRHQHQQQPAMRERARVEQGHGADAPLGRPDDGQAGQPLNRPEAGSPGPGRTRPRRPPGRSGARAGRSARPRTASTISPASSMARGSPARIVRPNVPARTPVQASREGMVRGWESRRTQSSWTGTQLMPGHQPEVRHLGRHRPGEGERQRTEEARHARQAQAAEEGEHPEPGDRPGQDHVQGPGRHRWQEGEQQRERVGGPGVPAGQQRGAAPDVRVVQRQVAAADVLPGEHAQREVLGQVVPRQHRVPEQRRDAVHEDG